MGAQTDSCGGIFPGSSGTLVTTPKDNINFNCGYPGSAPGGGAVVIPCSYYCDGVAGKLVAPPSGYPDFAKQHCKF